MCLKWAAQEHKHTLMFVALTPVSFHLVDTVLGSVVLSGRRSSRSLLPDTGSVKPSCDWESVAFQFGREEHLERVSLSGRHRLWILLFGRQVHWERTFIQHPWVPMYACMPSTGTREVDACGQVVEAEQASFQTQVWWEVIWVSFWQWRSSSRRHPRELSTMYSLGGLETKGLGKMFLTG